MRRPTVTDVMTRGVVTARPDWSFKQIVQLFLDNEITAVPVVDDESRPVGVVSEADLLRKAASLPDPEERLAGRRLGPHEPTRADAETAEAMMIAPVVTARPGWSLVETARTMHRTKVKRLPVVDATGKLIGIVSRCDLLRPFLRDDEAISDEIHHDVLGATMGLTPGTVHVEVTEGVVTLAGRVEERTLIPVIERLCRSVDGVVAVHQSIDYAYDDLGFDLEPPRVHGTGEDRP
jgi:CBS domain-containing protein